MTISLDSLRRTSDALGIVRCDTCDRVIEGQVYRLREWTFCEEHFLQEQGLAEASRS
jgi:hypothetical protein